MSRKDGKKGTPSTKGLGCGSKKAKAKARREGYRGARKLRGERLRRAGSSKA